MKTGQIEDIYELSPLQQGMLFHTLSAPKSGVYFEQFSFPLGGGLNLKALERAWQQVVDRNSVLRSSFFWDDLEKPLQVVHRQVKLPIELLDWRGLPSGIQIERLDAYLQKDRERGFDLSKPPLMRLAFIRLGEDQYQIVWSFHHLLLDGWSLQLVLKEVSAFYETILCGQDLRLMPARPYSEYVAWLQQQDLSQAERFWRQTLKGFNAPTTLRSVYDSAKLFDREEGNDEQTISLSESATAALQNLARQHRLTLNTIIQGAWALLLGQYTGETDVVFGSVVSGRPPALAGVESMVGMFINTLPIRVRMPANEVLLSYFERLQAEQFEVRQYEYSPLVQVQGWSEVPRGTALFESVLIVENYPTDGPLQQEGEETEHANRFYERTNYPITLSAFPGQKLLLKISYDCALFNRHAIELLLRHFQRLLEAIITDPKQRISNLTLLTPEEEHQLLTRWNQTTTEYPRRETIHQLFEAQAAATPDAIALQFGAEQLSYAELNRRANQVAHYLQSRGVGVESRVGLLVERSIEMIVGMLGVLKAGGAYVPLDAQYPRERLEWMIEDAGVEVLLTQARVREQVGEQAAAQAREVVCLDKDWALIAEQSESNAVSRVEAENMASVIYTSGSTGNPKGVMTPHRACINRFHWMWETYPFTPEEICCQKTALSFVDCVWEVFGPLLKGIKLVIIPDAVLKDTHRFLQALGEASVTRIVLVPSLLRSMLDTGLNLSSQLPHLKYWITSGEAMPLDLFQRFREQMPQRILLNLYGSSEVAADATCFDTSQSHTFQSLPIGRPIANTQSYILDRHMKAVPVGVAGELYIGGDGLARGYLNHPSLTADRFVPHPFSQQGGARLYRTGDLARYGATGEIEFLGRVDYQVKIRGFRIELGEVETVLSQHAAVRECVVMAREDTRNEKRLVAYVVCHNANGESLSDIRRFLQAKLPGHMIPANFVRLDALPLTPNGKVDRRALPAPDQTRPEMDARFVAPRTQAERKIAAVWQDVLKVEQVGVHDNFFELGGHSLLIVQLRSKLREALGTELSMVDLFRHPTVGALAKALHLGVEKTRMPEPPLRENAGASGEAA